MPAADASKDVTVAQTTWRGIELEITHTTEYFSDTDHLAIRSAESVRLPITETGYRSHFLKAKDMVPFEGPQGYVLAWLEEAALSDAWKRYEADRRQLSLF